MKNWMIAFFMLFSISAFTQEVDTTAIRGEVDSLINFSRSLIQNQKLDKALQILQSAEKRSLEGFGYKSALHAKVLSDIGIVNYYMGNKDKVETLWIEVINIRKSTLGAAHPDYAGSLSNLGVFYMDISRYDKAEPLHLEAIKIREESLGKEHPEFSHSLNNLGAMYRAMGQYEKAEAYWLSAKKIREKVFGKGHQEYAASLMNLAVLYRDMGEYEKSEQLQLQAKTIREETLGSEHPYYATSLMNLASLYTDLGKYKQAESLHLQAKSIWEKASATTYPDYRGNLINMGFLYQEMEQFDHAEQYFLQALSLLEKESYQDHPDYALGLNNLAFLYRRKGDYKKSLNIQLEAKNIKERVLGKDHPMYTHSLSNLAFLYWKFEQFSKSKELYLENNNLEKRHLIQASNHLSERELFAYFKKFVESQSQLLSFTQYYDLIPNTVFDNVLFYKGYLLNINQYVNRLAQNDSLSVKLINQLKAYNRRLAKEYTKPIIERNDVTELEEKANNLEKELVRSVAGYGDAIRQVNWQEVQATLKPGEVALEFVNYEYYKPEPTDSVMYAALLIRPDDEEPEFIPLFEEKQLGALLSGASQEENIALAYDTRGIVPKKKVKKEGLYQLIWQPLEGHLDGVKNIYYSPGGALHRINFAAIPVADHSYLSDRYQLTRLGSTRSTVVKDLNNADANNAILFGGIEYKKDFAFTEKSVDTTLTVHATATGELPFSYADRSIGQREEGWKYLPGTQKEIENISQLLDQSGYENRSYSGFEASEEVFKKIGKEKASPRILHIATHGFFFPDPVDSLQGRGSEPVFKISDHPMIRSGLVLAGSNQAWKTGQAASPELEDGILTAYEISQMDLSHTELVVLSACETGLGDIDSNEGVYGLQRAFKIAGAKYLIMSLWQIPDQQTQELMTLFYSKWLEGGLEIPQAFQSAQKEMRATYPNPYLWAGFVLME